ncbi:MAG TPA: hypothetical protein VJW20_03390 [Candidatus Angelobacter sp.]|nr:hypothetical protein [Candidatus Angelobacter sp.]
MASDARVRLASDPAVTMRNSYGFRTYRVLELALYHSLGKLPKPNPPTISSDEQKKMLVESILYQRVTAN